MKLLLINFFHLAALATARHAMKLAESAVAATENLATKAAATSNRVDQIEQNQANMQAKTNDIEAKIEEDKNKMKVDFNTLDEKQTQLENNINNTNQHVAEELAKLKERMSHHGPVINTMEFGKDIEILFFIRSNIL